MRNWDYHPLADRLMRKLRPNCKTGCIEWTGGRTTSGYGMIRDNHRILTTHRVMYSVSVGPIPIGLCVLHRCDNRICCNPKHLFLGTNSDNILDRIAKGRSADAKGEKNPAAKLTDREVKIIRRSPLSGPLLAKRFKVSRCTINAIKRREQWAHIP